MNGGDVSSLEEARRLLGVAQGASPDALKRAYRAAVRKFHPDHGGDAETLRRVIEARRLLAALPAPGAGNTGARAAKPRAAEPPHPLPLKINLMQAVSGGVHEIRLPDGRTGRMKLPPGLRPGDRVRLAVGGQTLLFHVTAITDPFFRIQGDDIWTGVTAPATLLQDGGEIEVEAPTGRKRVTVAAGAEVLRLAGEGLPGRQGRPSGHLFIRLQPKAEEPAAPAPPRARDLLRRFTAVWAA
jgi:curved DNA-binding protein